MEFACEERRRRSYPGGKSRVPKRELLVEPFPLPERINTVAVKLTVHTIHFSAR